MAVVPFRIDIPQADLDDLAQRLERTRWADVMDGAGWTYGADDDFMHDLIAAWRSFDWRAREAELNRFPQFKARIDGEGVHFVHVRGRGPNPAPLILTHGWPSSFLEYLGLVGPLTDPAAHGGDPADAFDVIVPSLPGYGFSNRPTKPGMTPRRIAELWVKLMTELGYDRFAAHGCDWGSYVTSVIGLDHPDRVLGVHMGTVSLGVQRAAGPARERTPGEIERARARQRWAERETGYSHLQGTKPQTLAYGLSDSPAGLAAWIGEKWRAWQDRTDPRCAIPREALLTNLAIYWFTRTINSSARIYYESRANPVRLNPGERVSAPSGFFLETPPGERNRPAGETTRTGGAARAKAEEAFNVQRWFEAPRGGHFPALETPDLLIEELRAFFRPLRPSGAG
jgi:pimeloyl-ACP methyl ester carboxylesterase